MSLSSEQIQQIKRHIYNIYGDTKELASFENEFKLTGALQLELGPQKIDLINHVKEQPTKKIQ